jgi:hypothetical protein
MKTSEVKCNKTYLLDNKEEVTVISRILGVETNKRNMQSGELFTGCKRKQKNFLLSNGLIVKADRLFVINN